MKLTNRFIDGNFNKTHLKYTFTNGAYIEFFSADDDSKLRGARRDILYINEANNISFNSYNELYQRTHGDIYIDFNPTNKFWAHDEVLKEDDSELLILTYLDNEAIDSNTLQMFEQNRLKALTSDYWKNWWNVYALGKIGSLEGVIFNNYSTVDRIPKQAELVGYGLDFGFTNDPTALIAVYRYDNNIYVDELIYQKGLTNREISKLIKSNGVNGIIYADSAEPKSIQELKLFGHKILPTIKGKDSINFGINILQDYNLHVTKKSLNLIKELKHYSWKKDKEGSTLNIPIDAFNHAIDALRYLAIMKLKTTVSARRKYKFI